VPTTKNENKLGMYIKMDIRDIYFEDSVRNELAQDRVQLQAMVSVVLMIPVLVLQS
jgi:hypothetical protein